MSERTIKKWGRPLIIKVIDQIDNKIVAETICKHPKAAISWSFAERRLLNELEKKGYFK